MLQHPLSSTSGTSSSNNTPINNRRIEVVVKQQVRMRSLAIKSTSSASSPLTPNTNATTTTTSNYINQNNEDDWLNQARYTGCRNDRAKPPYSYASLIAQAILASSERRLTLGEIYQWIMRRYPYYQSQNSGWQNSIRHNLSLNRCFIKLERSCTSNNNSGCCEGTPGKGSNWTIDESLMGELNDSGLFKRRKHRTEKRKREPLSDITNSHNNNNSYSRAMSLTPNNKNSSLMDEGILRLFTAPNVQHEMELPPMEIIEECAGHHQGLRNTLVCPELTEENFSIPGQIIFTSEYY